MSLSKVSWVALFYTTQVLCYGVMSWFISQENQVGQWLGQWLGQWAGGGGGGAGIMNYTRQFTSYGFDQVTLICIKNCVFQQSIYSMRNYKVFCLSDSIIMAFSKTLKLVIFLSYRFLLYNFDKLIRTLLMITLLMTAIHIVKP